MGQSMSGHPFRRTASISRAVLLTVAVVVALLTGLAGPTSAQVVEPPPARSPHHVTVTAGLPAAVTLTAFDPDGDSLTFTVVDQPAHGSLTGAAPALTYTADAGYSGPDRLTYTAFDGELTSNLGVFQITVVPSAGASVVAPSPASGSASAPAPASPRSSASASSAASAVDSPVAWPSVSDRPSPSAVDLASDAPSVEPSGEPSVEPSVEANVAPEVPASPAASVGASAAPERGDTTAPVLVMPVDWTVEATGPDGVRLAWRSVGSDGVTVDRAPAASDAVDGDLVPSCDRLVGDWLPVGRTTMRCSATDAAANVSTGEVTVTVVDTTAPEIRLTGGPAEGATYDAGAVSDAPACTATDAVDGAAVCDLRGYDEGPGDHILTVTATDAAGNQATVRVAYAVTAPALTATVAPTEEPAPTPTVEPTVVPTEVPTEEPAQPNAPPVIPDGTPVGAAR